VQIRRRLSLLFAPLVFALTLDAAPQPQKPKLPILGETIDVSIVNVDVVVTDKNGNRVRGLRRDDFEILENRKNQAISNFAEFSSAASVDGAAVTADVPQNVEAAPRQRRTVVLFIEEMKLIDFEAKRMIESLRELLAKTIEPGDAVSIVLWGRATDMHMAYTDRHQEIDKHLDKVLHHTTGQTYDPTRNLREDVAATREWEAELTRRAEAVGLKTVVLDPVTAGETAANLQATQAMTEMKRRVAAINATINSMAGRDGKKILILATRRLGDVAGGEFFFTAGTDILQPETRQRYGTTDLIKTIVDNANSSRVTIYPIYPAGLADAMPDAAVRPAEAPALDDPLGAVESPRAEALTMLNEMVSLADIAEKTGGLVAGGVKEIVQMLPRVEEDMSDYYSLAYRIDSDRSDKVRDIVVRAKNPEYQVRSRRQYVEKADATRMKDRVVATLFRDFEDSAFAIRAEFGTPRKQGRRDLFPLKIHIPIKHLTVLPNGENNAGAFSVFVATSIHVGRLSEVTQQTQPFEIKPAEMQRAMAGHFTYNFDLVVDNNVDRVAVGVFDEISKTYGLLRLPIPGRQSMISALE
jgi:VWFA-related protein